MADRIKLRRDTAANWTATNPVLAQGEPGFETDTDFLKVGDGVTAWNALSYVAGVGAFVSKTGDTMTGPLSVPAGASGAQVPQAQEIGTLANAQLTTHYKRSNILGTVSQSGGVPTGAVIEKGSNAVGYYTRWADGTQITGQYIATSSSGTTEHGFPAAFSGGVAGYSAVLGTTSPIAHLGIAPSGSPAGSFLCASKTSAGAFVSQGVFVVTYGRWF